MKSRAWLVPAIYATIAIVAGVMLPRAERYWLPSLAAGMSVPAAMAIYSSIASGMIALTGIVFSLVFVMVQFSSTAYSPRLVLWVARNPLITHALGVFTATFVYAIAALAWVDRGGQTVPLVSAVMVMVLLLSSVAVFIGLIERVAMLRVNRMLAFIGDRGREVINTIYPDARGAGLPAPLAFGDRGAPSLIVPYHGRPAAVQVVRVAALVRLAEAAGAVIEVGPAVGDTVIDSCALLTVYGGSPIKERQLRRALALGEERTFDQDPKYAIRLLVDIAIRALSPAVNDPTTAVQALDQIGDVLLRLAARRLDIGTYCDSRGVPRVVVRFPAWEDFLMVSFDEIRTYGATSVQVMRRMTALVADLRAAAPEELRPALVLLQSRLERTIVRTFVDREDRIVASVEDRQGLGVPRRRPAA